MLFAFLAVVTGSQQMLVLPGEKLEESDDDFETSTGLDAKDRYQRDLKQSDRLYLDKVVERLQTTRRGDRPNSFLVFALQAPLMLLTLSVITFLAGLCAVVFAPLASKPEWGNNAKVCFDVSFQSKLGQPVCTDRDRIWYLWCLVHRHFLFLLILVARPLPLATHPQLQDDQSDRKPVKSGAFPRDENMTQAPLRPTISIGIPSSSRLETRTEKHIHSLHFDAVKTISRVS